MKYKSVIGRNTKLTTEEVREYVESFGYKLIGEYISSKVKIQVQCPNDHEPYYVSWGNFKTGKRCPKCKFEKLSNQYRRDEHYVENYIRSYGYEWIDGDYVNGKSKIILWCDKGHEYTTSFDIFRNGFRCPHCYGNAKLSYDEVKNKILNEGFTLLSDEYINTQNKLTIECMFGHVFEMTWNHFQQGERCPYCNVTNGIYSIINILESHGVYYELEYTFDDCKNIKALPFDVYIPSKRILIEFDGEQHFLDGAFGKDTLNLMNIKYRDNIKNTYCDNNNLTLIRIPYWDINRVEEILNEFLN